MQTGAITSYVDVAQVALYAFWLFFAGLIWYLRQEDKREGYPLENDRSDRVLVQGLPPIPRPKSLKLAHEGSIIPHREERNLDGLLIPAASWPGAPMQPLGDPMQDGVGPASYALRADVPDVTFDEQLPKIVPLRAAGGYYLAAQDPDPRGYQVVTADGRIAGTVVDCWVDRSETVVRYLEAEAEGASGMRRIVFPMALSRIDPGRRIVKVASVLSYQFVGAPMLKDADTITLREEDRICGYFAGGHLYATPQRLGPLV
ncbi:photosynthetic reaction center subunit H [Belnapia sp. T6]|uniref:Photosynthetic reaction center subunit H n=1 Tax=Belnapia mucosa TaxID=2804532 RepID=A0ABS1V1U7_9PROT|nr:photosynthetic reaction center subunit H [Belnapia mucosa]MBL6455670.1 photosynthetic reaction center subunit H [Belnapia mucosa]